METQQEEPAGAGSRDPRWKVDTDVDRELWQDLADRSGYATFFHTPAWHRAFAGSNPLVRIATRVYRFDDGVVALLPLLETRRFAGLWRTHQSTAAGCYGGLIGTGTITEDHLSVVLADLGTVAPNLIWRINPLDPNREFLESVAGIQDTTEILDLGRFADDQELRRHYRHSARKQIGKGERSGLEARVADGWPEWERYYAIYERRVRQWGQAATSHHPLALFRAFFEERRDHLRLWVVLREGEIIGGNLNFYHQSHCVEWHAAYLSDYFHLGIRDFLVDWIIRDARASGYRTYDFNPSGGHDGARRFKKTFGAESVPSSLILIRRGPYGLQRLRALSRLGRSVRDRLSTSRSPAPAELARHGQ